MPKWRKINKAKRHDPWCRNNNRCSACRRSRTYQGRKAQAAAVDALKEYTAGRD